jgi:hypothetical protein
VTTAHAAVGLSLVSTVLAVCALFFRAGKVTQQVDTLGSVTKELRGLVDDLRDHCPYCLPRKDVQR